MTAQDPADRKRRRSDSSDYEDHPSKQPRITHQDGQEYHTHRRYTLCGFWTQEKKNGSRSDLPKNPRDCSTKVLESLSQLASLIQRDYKRGGRLIEQAIRQRLQQAGGAQDVLSDDIKTAIQIGCWEDGGEHAGRKIAKGREDAKPFPATMLEAQYEAQEVKAAGFTVEQDNTLAQEMASSPMASSGAVKDADFGSTCDDDVDDDEDLPGFKPQRDRRRRRSSSRTAESSASNGSTYLGLHIATIARGDATKKQRKDDNNVDDEKGSSTSTPETGRKHRRSSSDTAQSTASNESAYSGLRSPTATLSKRQRVDKTNDAHTMPPPPPPPPPKLRSPQPENPIDQLERRMSTVSMTPQLVRGRQAAESVIGAPHQQQDAYDSDAEDERAISAQEGRVARAQLRLDLENEKRELERLRERRRQRRRERDAGSGGRGIRV